MFLWGCAGRACDGRRFGDMVAGRGDDDSGVLTAVVPMIAVGDEDVA
jgi:hypothetical protein